MIPNTEYELKRGSKKKFWLRIFASDINMKVEEIPETLKTRVTGKWADGCNGGPLYYEKKVNPRWCQNPQYFLNIKQGTHMKVRKIIKLKKKIILKKIGKATKRNRYINIGLSICKHEIPEKETYDVLKAEGIDGKKKEPMEKFLKQISQHLKAPELENKRRKLQRGSHEMYLESTFCSSSKDIGCLYFHFLRIQGPFVIIPCMEKPGFEAQYELVIYSNNPVDLEKLDDKKNQALIGNWEQDTAGGCHLYVPKFFKDADLKNWAFNPTYLLKFDKTDRPANVVVTLKIAEKNWIRKLKNRFKEIEENRQEKGAQKGEVIFDLTNFNFFLRIKLLT